MPQFEIKLETPPALRWLNVTQTYREPIHQILKWMQQQNPNYYKYQQLFEDVEKYISQPWADELRGVAAGAQINVGDAVMLNLCVEKRGSLDVPTRARLRTPADLWDLLFCRRYYELNSACTSIVAQHPNGTIYHARNLDYNSVCRR